MKNYIQYFFLMFFLLLFESIICAQSIGGTTSGGTSFCTTTNSGFISLSGHNGVVQNWQFSTNGGVTWISIGNTTLNQIYFNVSQNTCYRAIVKAFGFPADTSTISCITIYPTSDAGVLTGGGLFCGSNATGGLTLSGNNVSVFGWEFSTDGGLSWRSILNTTNTENISGVTQSTLYRVIVQGGSCPKDTSNIDSVIVFPETVGGSISGPGAVCAGLNSGNLLLTGQVGDVIGWRFSTNNGVTWNPIANRTSSNAYSNLTQETWYQAMVQSGKCSIDTVAEIITVDSSTAPGILSGGGVFCGSNASGVLNLTGNNGSILDWKFSTDGGTTWQPIANTSNTEAYSSLSQTTLYQVSVQNGVCSILNSNIDTVFVAPQTVAGTVLKDTAVCPYNNKIDLMLLGNVGRVVSWLFSMDGGLTWNSIANTTNTLSLNNLFQNTKYCAVVQSENCNIDTSNIVTVTIHPVTSVSAGRDTLIYFGETVRLSGVGTGTPMWSPGSNLNDSLIFTPLATPNDTTAYILTVVDINGCNNSDSVIVFVSDTSSIDTSSLVSDIKIINLFTPNGDGINDYWFIENIENNPGNEVFVYNNNGHIVYSQENYSNNWEGTFNGEPLPDGTYYYVVKINNPSRIFKSSVDILR